MNMFAMFLAFLIGTLMVWTFFDKIIEWITKIMETNEELAVFMVGAVIIFAILFLIIHPIGIGTHDENKA